MTKEARMAQRRDRQREAADLVKKGALVDAWVEDVFKPPPQSWRVVDESRQATAIVSDESAPSNGALVRVAGIDTADYWALGAAVFLNHKDLIGWCVDLEVRGSQLIGTVQFPPAGRSSLADSALERVRNGQLSAASISVSALETRIADGVPEIVRSALTEWSLAPRGGNVLCKVLSVGGRSNRGCWDDPRNPRRPEPTEAGPSAAHWAAALRRLPALQSAAAWR
jgi:hypothetical protein